MTITRINVKSKGNIVVVEDKIEDIKLIRILEYINSRKMTCQDSIEYMRLCRDYIVIYLVNKGMNHNLGYIESEVNYNSIVVNGKVIESTQSVNDSLMMYKIYSGTTGTLTTLRSDCGTVLCDNDIEDIIVKRRDEMKQRG